MAAVTDAPAAAPAAAGASMADIDMKLLWTAGAVGLYATGTLLNGLRKAWYGDGEACPIINATPASEMAILRETCDGSLAAPEAWDTDARAD